VVNKDIRVDLGFFEHRKTRKLISRFGLEAAWGLLRLWAFAARSRPDGRLTGMTVIDVAMEMHYESGLHEDLLCFMCSDECRWLEQDGQTLILHGWAEHNPWAAGSQDRSDASRFSRMAKTHPQIFKNLQAKGVKAVSTEEYQSLTKPQRIVNAPLSPAPSPVPSPVPNTKPLSPKKRATFPEWFETWWSLYPARNGKRAGKQSSFDIARNIPEDDRPLLIKATKNYSSSTDSQFARDPERFLKKDYWRDLIDIDSPSPKPPLPASKNRDGFA
jgi:hypothetical protein